MGSLDGTPTISLAPWLLALLILTGALVGLGFGYLIFSHQVEAVQETVAMPIQHPDGSVTAMRDPKATLHVRKPSKPAGGRPVRAIEAVVKPADPDCAPIPLRIDLDEYDDGLRASMVTGGGAEILDAVDKPLAAYIRPVSRPWAVGFQKDLMNDGAKIALAADRDIGNLRLGASVGEDTAQVRILWKVK